MFKNDTWYQVDLLIDWTNQAVTVYIDQQQMASDKFFTNSKTTINTMNTIILYNLAPGTTCGIKDVKICDVRCIGKLFYGITLLRCFVTIK